jgi:hypothetical protein
MDRSRKTKRNFHRTRHSLHDDSTIPPSGNLPQAVIPSRISGPHDTPVCFFSPQQPVEKRAEAPQGCGAEFRRLSKSKEIASRRAKTASTF